MEEDIKAEVGKRIKKIRKERKITQKELATLANVSQCVISKTETQGTNLTLEVLNRIATALDVRTYKLFK